MTIVLDTNVLAAALLSPSGPPAAVLQLILSGSVVLCFDARILTEYRQVLARPRFNFDSALVEDVLAFLETEGDLVAWIPLNLSLPDPADGMFIEVGVAATVDHLVTGSLKHFPTQERQGLAVMSPREFINLVTE